MFYWWLQKTRSWPERPNLKSAYLWLANGKKHITQCFWKEFTVTQLWNKVSFRCRHSSLWSFFLHCSLFLYIYNFFICVLALSLIPGSCFSKSTSESGAEGQTDWIETVCPALLLHLTSVDGQVRRRRLQSKRTEEIIAWSKCAERCTIWSTVSTE